jgi:N-formylglutamate deformylase
MPEGGFMPERFSSMATYEEPGQLAIPPWVVFHVPHDSIEIPQWVVEHYVVSDDELAEELIKMTDHFTLDLFVPIGLVSQSVRASVSRLVVDVERFEDDSQEAMAQIGMGCVYKSTSDMKTLRGDIAEGVRQRLLEEYYFPHHQRLEASVDKCLQVHGRCLVVDCHSFPSKALPYERVDVDAYRPDICIGSDDFHSPKQLIEANVIEFQRAGWSVRVNDPFAGALVPASKYKLDNRVSSIMVEVNRALYMDEKIGMKLDCFSEVQAKVIHAYSCAISRYWSHA